MDVIVERLPGDRQGPDITDALLTSEAAGIERGRQEIDAECSSRELVQSSGVLREFIRSGRIVEVGDTEQQQWRGIVRSCAIVIDRTEGAMTATASLTIERGAK